MSQHEHVHILGIAGHTMRGVALALQNRGYTVTGTDTNAYPPGSDWLDEHQIKWWREPDAKHLEGVTLLVLGGGESIDQPELVEAQRRGIKIKSYPEVVGELVKAARRIVITGTHGKTTTTSMIAWVLESAGRKPDFLVGVQPNNFDTSVRLGDAKVAVLEGDEYRSSAIDDSSKFKYYHPTVVVITSIEHDHPDLFPDLQSVKDRFISLVQGLSREDHLYVCDASSEAIAVAAESGAPISTYGHNGEWHARDAEYLPEGLMYKLVRHGKELGKLSVPLYGEHNILNSLAVASVVMNEGLNFEQLAVGLGGFRGAARRFERLTSLDSKITVIDDYAHHPTEVAATIAAAKRHFGGRVVAIFRPHTYSRTAALLTDYHQAFAGADQTYITPIEGARESTGGVEVSGADIASGAGDNVAYEPDRAKLIKTVLSQVKPGDTILCMSVNGYERLAQELMSKL